MNNEGWSDALRQSRAGREIVREALRAEGMNAALAFAIRCRLDVHALVAERQEHEAMIESGVGPWGPGASTRIYQDAYIAGLQLALDIIRRNEPSTTQAGKYMPPGEE